MGFPSLDVILSLSAPAVEVLVEGTSAAVAEVSARCPSLQGRLSFSTSRASVSSLGKTTSAASCSSGASVHRAPVGRGALAQRSARPQ